MSNTNDTPDLAETIDITFPDAININGSDVFQFQLTREPTGNDLGRHTLPDLLDGNVRALANVTPKLITPYLSPKVIKDMGAKNMMALTLAYSAFFEGVDMEGMAKPGEKQASTTKTPAQPSSSGQKVA